MIRDFAYAEVGGTLPLNLLPQIVAISYFSDPILPIILYLTKHLHSQNFVRHIKMNRNKMITGHCTLLIKILLSEKPSSSRSDSLVESHPVFILFLLTTLLILSRNLKAAPIATSAMMTATNNPTSNPVEDAGLVELTGCIVAAVG